MTLQEMIPLARNGVKMTHEYFTSEEYLTMKGNMVIFEDGVQIMLGDYTKGRDFLNNGWSEFKE